MNNEFRKKLEPFPFMNNSINVSCRGRPVVYDLIFLQIICIRSCYHGDFIYIYMCVQFSCFNKIFLFGVEKQINQTIWNANHFPLLLVHFTIIEYVSTVLVMFSSFVAAIRVIKLCIGGVLYVS
jgi:hypothetical protein